MRQRILFIISSLSAGGGERALTNLANYWSGQEKEIIIMTLDDGSRPPFYTLESGILHIPLGISGHSPNVLVGIWNNLKRISVLRKKIRSLKADKVISYIDLTNVMVLLATIGMSFPVFVVEQSDPAITPIPYFWNRLRIWTYPRAQRVVVLHEKARDYFPGQIKKKTVIIPNPIQVEKSSEEKSRPFPGPTVIAMGRLSEEKRFDLLFKAFGQLKDSYPGWNLVLLGNGPLRYELESLRDELGLQKRVQFWGVVKDPHRLLRQADIFVLTSRFEGFPLALCEAMACGLPVISTEYHSGVRKIIQDGINGIIVPSGDATALGAALRFLMGDATERKRMASQASRILELFGVDKISEQWDLLINR